MTRRSPEGVLAVLEMDPARRQMFVEGPTDRHFFEWLVRECDTDDLVIEDADALDIPEENGNRDRLVALAQQLGHSPRLLVLVDADGDDSVQAAPGETLVLTDRRDLEGYLLDERCFDKVIKLGVATDALDAPVFLRNVLEEARKVGILRKVSVEQEWKLPFRKTELHPAVTATKSAATIDIHQVAARLATKSIGLARLGEILDRFSEMEAKTSGWDDYLLVHGKDACAVVSEVLIKHGISRADAVRLLRMSFERPMVAGFPNLSLVFDFMCAA
jgi:hypothetical protein